VKFLLATRSAHKLREVERILAEWPDIQVVGLAEAGIPVASAEDDLEPYDTFEENAASKARYFHDISGLPTVADDSGLVVDALGGAPGVRSKRFAPDQGRAGVDQDTANNEHLLQLLGDRPPADRTARYVCVATLITDESEWSVRGEAEGIILAGPQGGGGFGYDPLFLDRQLGRSFAELTDDQKNERSHRGEAFRALAAHIASSLPS